MQGLWLASTLSGSQIRGEPKGKCLLEFMIERISQRLDKWKKASLSLGGRITLIPSCLSHIPSYFLYLLKIPSSMTLKINAKGFFFNQGLGSIRETIRLVGT